jgi:FkbM family methyltransferase
MSNFISYAQNFEDVMLWRALKHIENGFYIDVGANDPEIDSVTKAFYELGWRGMNIEPVPQWFQRLKESRLRDINLEVAVGSEPGTITLCEIPDTGLSTVDKVFAERHVADQGYEVRELEVPMETLSNLCERYHVAPIHFLKIDVEGMEKSVLEGVDFEKLRPWIVLLESMEPNSQEESHSEWEPILLDGGYHFVYSDGLNRFYLANEHRELLSAFKYPPNVHDNFLSKRQQDAELLAANAENKAQEAESKAQQAYWRAEQAEVKAQEAESKARQADWRAEQAESKAKAKEAEEKAMRAECKAQKAEQAEALTQLHAVYASNSWRITAPLRWGGNQYRLLRQNGLKNRLTAACRKTLLKFIAFISSRPALRQALLRTAKGVGVYTYLKTLKCKALPQHELQLYSAPNTLRRHHRLLPTWPTLPETLHLPEPKSHQIRWVRLTGHLEGHYSLAIVNRGLAGALERINQQHLSFVPFHGQPYNEIPNLPPEQEAGLHAALRRAVPAGACQSAISVVHHYPIISDNELAGLRGIVFFWEEATVPADTIEHLNRHFDVVWVAAMSVKRALLNSGCCTPIFVIPIGVDHLITPDTKPLGALRVSDGQRLRFLHVSSVFERKGADVLLAAYLDAFTADDAVELYIKTFPNPHNQIHSQLDSLIASHDKPARVIIDEEPLEDAGMIELYRSAHAMVLPTRGEGFNLPAAEALAMALPVITTGYSAQVDFCSHATATLLNFNFATSRSHLRASDAYWLEPDRSDLADKLQLMHKRILTGDPTLEAQRQSGLRHVRETYNWDNSARSLLASADWMARQPGDEPGPLNLALISPWATRCGIAEYSQKLLHAIVRDPEVQLSVYCDDRTDSPSANAVASWTLGNNSSMLSVLESISQSDANVVLMQHQPSLFPLSDACCAQLAELSQQGRVTMLELHSTRPLLEECPLSAAAVISLAQLDRVIVHKVEDLNRLLELGLANNVMLLPLGVVQPLSDTQPETTRAELGIPADALVLGSFGFALEHKGIDTLVETLKPLASASGRPVHMLAVNSILDERSEIMIQQYQKRARQIGVDEQIHWITDYRPIEYCQNLLGTADYVVFPYKHTRESASGAVTIGLSTLKPVLVSPLDIFSDLPDVTWTMDGHESEDIVRAVQALEGQPEFASGLLKRQHHWLHARNWHTLSERLLTVMSTLRRERRLSDAIGPARRDWEASWKNSRRKQLLVDVSELYHRDARTGIQRVVRNILSELLKEPPAGYDICPVYGDKFEGFRHTSKFESDDVSLREGQPVEPGDGDVFLGLDLSAHLFPEAEQQLAAFRLAGVRVYYVIYDIIPLRHPQFTVSGISDAFDKWLRSLARTANGLICISNTVAKDVEGWLYEQMPNTPLPDIHHFHLGADISHSSPTSGLPENSENVLAAMDATTSFLMVGTIEPRKGYMQTLDAFERLWAKGESALLVMVGKQGWDIDAFAQSLRSHMEAGKRLLWIEGASDEYLEKIYSRADCLIAASECEGFGLPLIEAAQHKLPIIARNISVFHEVAGEHAFYFSGEGAPDMEKAIKNWLELYSRGEQPLSDRIPWLTWRESASQLVSVIFSDIKVRCGG